MFGIPLIIGLAALMFAVALDDSDPVGDEEDPATPNPETPDPANPDPASTTPTEGDDLLNLADNSIVDGLAGNDTIEGGATQGTVSGGDGDDLINVQGTLDRISGGSGNDTITADSADFGGGSPVFGDDGDDLLTLTNSPAFQIGSAADGGAGNDTIRTQTLLDSGDSATYDTLTGGDGEDRFELSFSDVDFGQPGTTPAPVDIDVGVVTTITDFQPGVDQLLLEADVMALAGPDAATLTSFVIREDAGGAFTDVVFTGTDTESAATLTGTVRLLDVTQLSITDVVLESAQPV